MLEALLAGETDPAAMADLAKKRMRVKIPQLTEALYGRYSGHHAFLTRMHLDLIDQHTAAIEQLTDRIEVVMEPFRSFRDLICTIPGIGGYTADVVVAETGADMTKFRLVWVSRLGDGVAALTCRSRPEGLTRKIPVTRSSG
ncbi:MAG: transposase [Mycobacterium sp.]|jgi:transposase|nr:transposase [Mycobacterium sp.]